MQVVPNTGESLSSEQPLTISSAVSLAPNVIALPSPDAPASPAPSHDADDTTSAHAQSLHSSVTLEKCTVFNCSVTSLRRNGESLLLLEAMVRLFFEKVDLIDDVAEVLVKRSKQQLPVCSRPEELAFVKQYQLPAQELTSKLLVSVEQFESDFAVVYALLRRRGKIASDKYKLVVNRKRAPKTEPNPSPNKRRSIEKPPIDDDDVIIID